MKEIIYKIKHKEEDCKECVYSGMCVKDLCEVEHETQVPETWEELKELCKDLESKNVFIINAGNCIEFNGLYFWKDGSITTTQNNNDIWATKTNLTSARQWQIIKSLIGEE